MYGQYVEVADEGADENRERLKHVKRTGRPQHVLQLGVKVHRVASCT